MKRVRAAHPFGTGGRVEQGATALLPDAVPWRTKGARMCIVTISRGSFSGAKAVAEGVAERLEAPCVSREVIVEAASAAGISTATLDEVLDRPPTFFERVSRERDTYMVFVRAALYRQAAQGTFVYHGHDGHLMLDLPNVLRVRVVAPLEARVAVVMEAQDIDERAARRYVEKIDAHREKWTRFLYGVAWDDPLLYDLIVNLEKMGAANAIDLVVETARTKPFAWTDDLRREASSQALCDLVWSELAKVPECRRADLQVTAEGGVVLLSGKAPSAELRRMVVEAAGQVQEATEIRSEISIPSDILKS